MLSVGNKLVWGGVLQVVVSVNSSRARISPANIDISPESPSITEDEYLALVISNTEEIKMPSKKSTAPKKVAAPKKSTAPKKAGVRKYHSPKVSAIINILSTEAKTKDDLFIAVADMFSSRGQFNAYCKNLVITGELLLSADGVYLSGKGVSDGK